MNHRWGSRLKTQLTTLLYDNGIPVASGKTKDLAQGGIFVELKPGACPTTRSLDVELRINSGLMKGSYRLPVLIIRRSSEGVAMMFRALDKKNKLIVSTLVNSLTNDIKTSTARVDSKIQASSSSSK